MNEPFNPLGVPNVGVTLAIELLRQDDHELPPLKAFSGAGIYALYYRGPLDIYAPMANINSDRLKYPIYIGSAVREGAKLGFKSTPETNPRVFARLGEHAKSISQAENLNISDFRCRYLILDDAFILLAESVLIGIFRPLWNGTGFGAKVVGKFRMAGKGSGWDVLHPGRPGRPAGTQSEIHKWRQYVSDRMAQLGSRPTDDAGFGEMFDKIVKFL